MKQNPFYARMTDDQIATLGASWAWRNPPKKPWAKKPQLTGLAFRIMERWEATSYVKAKNNISRQAARIEEAPPKESRSQECDTQPSSDDTRLGRNSAAGSV